MSTIKVTFLYEFERFLEQILRLARKSADNVSRNRDFRNNLANGFYHVEVALSSDRSPHTSQNRIRTALQGDVQVGADTRMVEQLNQLGIDIPRFDRRKPQPGHLRPFENCFDNMR